MTYADCRGKVAIQTDLFTDPRAFRRKDGNAVITNLRKTERAECRQATGHTYRPTDTTPNMVVIRPSDSQLPTVTMASCNGPPELLRAGQVGRAWASHSPEIDHIKTGIAALRDALTKERDVLIHPEIEFLSPV